MDTKALRQKILDLAIRGKLVPQDPNDEPASVLLERIRTEKQKMVKDGKLKPKDIKNDTIIFKGEDSLHYEKFADGTVKCIEEEIPFELPQGWEWARLRNVCSIFGRIGFRGYTKNDLVEQGNGAITLSPSNIINNKMNYAICTYISWYKYDESPEIQISNKDILLVKTGSSYGKAALVENLPQPATINPQFVVLKNKKISAEYLCFVLQSLYARSVFDEFVVGTAIPTFTQEKLNAMYIPIPPLKEQNRIISKLNNFFYIIDTIENDKSTLQETIQLTKSKILDLAIRGKLVPQDPNDEPASVLLERIRLEKEELIKQGKIKRDKKESVIFKGEDNSYYQKIGNLVETLDDWQIDDLPETWGLCCLGEVCDYGNCTNVDTKDISDTAWILDLEDIEKDTGKVLQKFTKKERSSASTKHLFYKGQVLYSKLRPYLNKVVLADNDGYCTSEILPLDFNACIFPEYAKYYLMSPTFLRYANHCSYGVKMPRLGTQDGKKAVLTVPPINEQKRIANKISQLFSMLDSIEENIN